MAVQKQMKDFQEWGVERSIKAIDYSISKGWRGIYESREVMQANGAIHAPTSITDKIHAGKELERVRERKRIIRASYDPHQSWDDQDREEFKKLKEREAKLMQTIGAEI